jgi:hypothetical protein
VRRLAEACADFAAVRRNRRSSTISPEFDDRSPVTRGQSPGHSVGFKTTQDDRCDRVTDT